MILYYLQKQRQNSEIVIIGFFLKTLYPLVCIFYHYFALGCYNSTDKSTGHGISCVLDNYKFESFQFRFLSDIKMIIPYRVCILRSL